MPKSSLSGVVTINIEYFKSTSLHIRYESEFWLNCVRRTGGIESLVNQSMDIDYTHFLYVVLEGDNTEIGEGNPSLWHLNRLYNLNETHTLKNNNKKINWIKWTKSVGLTTRFQSPDNKVWAW